MQRRDLLATMGVGITGLAGCSSILDEEQPTATLTPVEVPPAVERSRRSGDTVDSCTGGNSEYRRDAPPVDDLPQAAATFDSVACPTFDWADEVVCYQTTALSSAALVLVGGRAVDISDQKSDIVDFVLLNRSGNPVRLRPDAWSILAREPRGWSTLLSGRPACVRTLEEEGAHWWSVGVDTTATDERDNVTPVSMGLLPGTYALSIPVRTTGPRDVACLAPFAVRESATETAPTAAEATPTAYQEQ